MGGPMGVHDALDWLEPERALLRAAVEAGLPVLGVCLGAQQLACALGGDVMTGAAPEVGVGEVHLTAAAIADPVFGPAPTPLPCVHWHGDTFTLPEAAVRLAGNDAYENQAFRVGCSGLRPAIPRRGHREPRRALVPAPPRRRLRASVRRRAREPGRGGHRAALRRAGGSRRDGGASEHGPAHRARASGECRGTASRHDLVPRRRQDLRHHASRGRTSARLSRRGRGSRLLRGVP